MKRESVLFWIIPILFSLEAQCLELFEGSSCSLHNGNSGICKLLSMCVWLRENLENKSMTFNQIVQCGFNGSEPIVCCENDRRQPINQNPVFNRPNESIGDFLFETGPNEIPNTTEDTFNTLPNRFTGEKIVEACQKYSKIAIPFTSDNILFGRPASLTEYPHMAALGYPNEEGGIDFDCGGSLISEQWVITAAHCITKKRPPTLVRMGVVYLDEDDVDPVDRTVIERVRNPLYNAEYKQNDIALLKLDRPIPFNDYVRPACIRTQIDDVSKTTELIITGWGSILSKKSQRPPVLQQANVTIVSLASCNETLLKYNELANQPSLRNGLLEGQICALDTSSTPDKVKDACVGDSGGPLFTYHSSGVSTLVGVVSFGVSCGTNLPSIYTRIASYVDWIESVVWPK